MLWPIFGHSDLYPQGNLMKKPGTLSRKLRQISSLMLETRLNIATSTCQNDKNKEIIRNIHLFTFSLIFCNFDLIYRNFELIYRNFDLINLNFDLINHNFILINCNFKLINRKFKLINCNFNLINCNFNLINCNFKLINRNFILIYRNFILIYRNFNLIYHNFNLIYRNFNLINCNINFEAFWRFQVLKRFDATLGIKKTMPHMASIIQCWVTWCHVWHRLLTPFLASKSCQTWYLQLFSQLRRTSLHLLWVSPCGQRNRCQWPWWWSTGPPHGHHCGSSARLGSTPPPPTPSYCAPLCHGTFKGRTH